MTDLTQEIARELLDYDPETGDLTWRIRGLRWFVGGGKTSAGSICKTWNKRFAGKIASARHNRGYAQITALGSNYLAHRVIWLYMTGAWPAEQVDHINGNRDDNRWANLRAVSPMENGRNQRMPKNNTSGFPGVSWNKAVRKWEAYIRPCKKKIKLGYFDTPESAHEVYASAALRLGFTNRHANGR